MFQVHVGRTFQDAARASPEDLAKWRPAIERVADLLRRMTTRQAEVAATVHFVSKELSRDGHLPTEADVLDEVMRWKARRKPPFNQWEVAEAIRNLALLDWIHVQASPELTPDEEVAFV